jgi:hypothetical protein
MGATPQKLASVKVGDRKITLSHDSYQTVERQVRIEFEQSSRVDVDGWTLVPEL